MIRINLLVLILLFSLRAIAQNVDASEEQKARIVQVSCGECQFGMKEKKGCNLAAIIKGKQYYIEGTTIDEHGDAHAKDGFCNKVRKAEVKGKIVNNAFVVSEFKLLPTAEQKRKQKKEAKGQGK